MSEFLFPVCLVAAWAGKMSRWLCLLCDEEGERRKERALQRSSWKSFQAVVTLVAGGSPLQSGLTVDMLDGGQAFFFSRTVSLGVR